MQNDEEKNEGAAVAELPPTVHVCELIAWLRQQQDIARVAYGNSGRDLPQGFYAGRFDAFESTIMYLEEPHE